MENYLTDEDLEELFILTDEQKKAFNKFKKAHEACKKLGLAFYNNYGYLGVIVKDRFLPDFYNDKADRNPIRDDGTNTHNEIHDSGFVSWADDDHYFHHKG